MAQTAFLRSKAYRLLSYAFFYPEEELAEFFRRGEFHREFKEALSGHPLAAGFSGAWLPLERLASFSPDQQVEEYVRLLTLKSKCPPYETEYEGEPGLFSPEGMADVAGFYRAFGMDFAKERPDHIAVELEFMHLVTLREAEAAFRGQAEKVDLCRRAEKNFLVDHLARWVGAFTAALLAEESSFYGPMGRLLERWIAMDGAYLNDCLGKGPHACI